MINDDPEKFKEYLPMIRKHLHKIENIVTCFEEYGHVSNEKLDISLISFHNLMLDILNENKLISKYPNVRYQINLLNSKKFYSDLRRLKIMLKHLVTNAFHFSSISDEPHVSITVDVNEKEGIVKVWNSGVFIEETIARNLFQLFFHGDNYSEGSGAGLFLVKEAVEKLAGTVNFISNPESGNAIKISLPNYKDL